jgi:hypothetical protein
MKKASLSMVSGNRAAVGTAAFVSTAVVIALALTPPGLAHSAPLSPSPSGVEDPMPPTAADPPADLPIENVEPLAVAARASGSDDDAEAHSNWVRSGDVETDDANPRDKVLEVPQAVDPANQQPSDQAARDGDKSGDQVGSIDDYQDEEDIGTGVFINQVPPGVTNPYGINTDRLNPGLNPAFTPHYMRTAPLVPNVVVPRGNGMNTAIGSTNPMLPTSRNAVPSPSGWWTRAR